MVGGCNKVYLYTEAPGIFEKAFAIFAGVSNEIGSSSSQTLVARIYEAVCNREQGYSWKSKWKFSAQTGTCT